MRWVYIHLNCEFVKTKKVATGRCDFDVAITGSDVGSTVALRHSTPDVIRGHLRIERRTRLDVEQDSADSDTAAGSRRRRRYLSRGSEAYSRLTFRLRLNRSGRGHPRRTSTGCKEPVEFPEGSSKDSEQARSPTLVHTQRHCQRAALHTPRQSSDPENSGASVQFLARPKVARMCIRKGCV